MPARIVHVTLVVHDYDEAIRFFTHALGFTLVEDTALSPTKRWVRVRPPGGGSGSGGVELLLAKAASPEQSAAVGRQAGGRVGFFLETDDFERDYLAFRSRGVKFLEQPRHEAYATVAVFEDVAGNRWDLLQYRHREEG